VKTLLHKPNGQRILAKSPVVTLPSFAPTVAGGQIRVCTDTDPVGVVFPLPTVNWKPIGKPTALGYRYKPGAPGDCNVTLKGGTFVKAKCPPHPTLAQPVTGRVRHRIRIGDNDYCSDCASDGSAGTVRQNSSGRLVVKDCPVAASCFCSASPSGAFLDDAGLF
jgi:hypothetical protein